VLAGLFQGFSISSSSSRTPVAESAGAKTQLTGVVGALCIALLLVFAPTLLQNLPNAALGAVVIASCMSLVDIRGVAPQWVVVAAEPVTDVDITAAEALTALDDDLEKAGIQLCFAEMKDPVKDRLKRYDLYAKIGAEHFFPTLGRAVDAYQEEHREVDWEDWEDGKPDLA
jgi:MFS superfamily sulfate permease-like transporter